MAKNLRRWKLESVCNYDVQSVHCLWTRRHPKVCKWYLEDLFLKIKIKPKILLGVIQRLRGQEGGRGVSKKSTLVHPGGVGESLDVHVDKNLKKGILRRIMANDYEKSYYST